jgi:hypothetical protein
MHTTRAAWRTGCFPTFSKGLCIRPVRRAREVLMSGKFVHRWFTHMNQSRGLLFLRHASVHRI